MLKKALTVDKTGFALNRFSGEPNTINAFLLEIKYIGDQNPKVKTMSNNGKEWHEFVMPVIPHEIIGNSYVRPPEWQRQNYNNAVVIPGESTSAKKDRRQENESKMKFNSMIDEALAEIMKIIKERCNSSFQSTFLKHNGDPYLVLKYLVDTYGNANNGVSEGAAAWAKLLCHQMRPEDTFQSSLVEAERLGNICGLTSEQVLHLMCVTKDQNKNSKIQMLPENMLPAISRVKVDGLTTEAATSYLAKQAASLVTSPKETTTSIQQVDETKTGETTKNDASGRGKRNRNGKDKRVPKKDFTKGKDDGAKAPKADAQPKVTCSFCGKTGHVEDFCWNKAAAMGSKETPNGSQALVAKPKVPPLIQSVQVDQAKLKVFIEQFNAFQNAATWEP